MNVKIEEVGKHKIKLEIEVGAEALEEGLDKSFKKNMKRFSVPGFRKGRAPRFMVERQYGVEVLYEDAVDAICPEHYKKAVEENNIEPVDSPEVELVQLERGKPFIFAATVTVRPEVALGEYMGLEVPYRQTLVTEEEVEAELKAAAAKNARLIPVEDRPSQNGDILIIDYEGSVGGVPFAGGKAEGHSLELGSKSFIEGFEEQLIGKNAGDEAEVHVKFPDDYGHEALNGKEAVFKVAVHAIKNKELPEIDDEFAQEASEFDTLDEYKADIRKTLTDRYSAQAKREFEDALVAKVTEAAEADIPEVMIERQAETDMREFEMSLAYQGLDLERYFEITKTDRAKIEETMKARAAGEVKTQLVLSQIAKEKDIDASDEDVEAEIRKRAEGRKKEYEEYKASLSEDFTDYLRSTLKISKVLAFLSENAKKI